MIYSSAMLGNAILVEVKNQELNSSPTPYGDTLSFNEHSSTFCSRPCRHTLSYKDSYVDFDTVYCKSPIHVRQYHVYPRHCI